jgi:hypothetical protein
VDGRAGPFLVPSNSRWVARAPPVHSATRRLRMRPQCRAVAVPPGSHRTHSWPHVPETVLTCEKTPKGLFVVAGELWQVCDREVRAPASWLVRGGLHHPCPTQCTGLSEAAVEIQVEIHVASRPSRHSLSVPETIQPDAHQRLETSVNSNEHAGGRSELDRDQLRPTGTPGWA